MVPKQIQRRQRVSLVVLHEDKVLGFHAEDPHSKKNYFFLPGGLIEAGETVPAAAQREALEETGYTVEIIDGVELTRHYEFEWNGVVNVCTTQFLAGKLVSDVPIEVHDADYHRGVDWVPVAEIATIFGYHKDILEAIELILQRLRMTST